MDIVTGKLAAIAIVVASLLLAGGLFGVGAVDVEQPAITDALFGDDEPQVVMAPHDGPNGQYVVEQENGKLRLDFTDPGLTRDARLQFHRVFDLINEDDEPIVVRVTHGNEDTIRVYDDATGGTIAGETNAISLTPGERVVVSVDVDSRGVTVDDLATTVTFAAQFDAPFFEVDVTDIDETVAAGQTVTVDAEVTNVGTVAGEQEVRLLVDGEVVDQRTVELGGPNASTEMIELNWTPQEGDEGTVVSIVVRSADDEETAEIDVNAAGESSGPSGDEGGSSSGDGESSIRTDVEFGDDDAEFSTRTVSRDEIIELDEATAVEPPRAFIHPRRGEPLDADRTVTIDGERRTLSADRNRIMLAGEPAVLSGERSTVSSGEAITSRDRMIGAVEINVPANRRNDPATVRFSMDRDRFGDSDPASATIGHRTDDGWELLSTEVVGSTDEEVVLTAETPGFSIFAVFADPQVRYEWTLPDGRTAEGSVLNHTFSEPGLYDVELTVSDAFGRVSTTSYQVVANDVPEATIEVVEREGEATTLAADVENEVGDTDVTWTFPDGTDATGTEVTHDLADGEHEITLHVVDEYGAESETRETIVVGPPWAAVGAAADSLGVSLQFMVQLSMVALIGGALALGYRRFPWGVFASTRRRGPEITAFESPTVDTAVGRFTIETVEVESGGSDLETITIESIESIDADGRTVIEKRIDASGMQRYTASPETLIAPPGAGFDREGRYTVRVKASDENGRSVERHASVAARDDGSIDTG